MALELEQLTSRYIVTNLLLFDALNAFKLLLAVQDFDATLKSTSQQARAEVEIEGHGTFWDCALLYQSCDFLLLLI